MIIVRESSVKYCGSLHLQHVLPKGFMKVRYYGFYHHSFSIDFEELKNIVTKALGCKNIKVKTMIDVKYQALCDECQCPLVYMFSILPNGLKIRPSP